MLQRPAQRGNRFAQQIDVRVQRCDAAQGIGGVRFFVVCEFDHPQMSKVFIGGLLQPLDAILVVQRQGDHLAVEAQGPVAHLGIERQPVAAAIADVQVAHDDQVTLAQQQRLQ